MTNTDWERKRQKAYMNRRSLMDWGMGIIYAGVGAFVMLAGELGIGQVFAPPFSYVFGGLCILYGGFRIFRGFKKNYFRE